MIEIKSREYYRPFGRRAATSYTLWLAKAFHFHGGFTGNTQILNVSKRGSFPSPATSHNTLGVVQLFWGGGFAYVAGKVKKGHFSGRQSASY